VVASTSLLIVALAALYVVKPSRPAIAVDIEQGGVLGNAISEVIYGKISASRDIRVSDIRIALGNVERISIPSTGAYRSVVRLKPHRYKVTVTLTANGKHLSASRTLRIDLGHAYDISVRVRSRQLFTILPVSSY